MGGFVLIRSYDPLDIIQLRFPMETELFFVLVNPKFEAPTKKMRAVLPSEIAMLDHISNSSQSRSLGKTLFSDRIVESKLTLLIPRMGAIKNAMIGAGAFGCTISGAGPTTVAVTDSELRGEKIGEKMVEVFWKEGNLKATSTVRSLDRVGASATDAFYKLSNLRLQIQAYVFDGIRASVSKLILDDVFEQKNKIAKAVEDELEKAISAYGYEIVQTLIIDIEPDSHVKQEEMNEINAVARLRMAANERVEAEKILQISELRGRPSQVSIWVGHCTPRSGNSEWS
ncbi:hypothetical protein GIB67_017850 [Kingdonia uniflora]|uniref:GHMP kinase C-terminal domain-containing protein n=1 Tax=Kingdonia uniflora TaxID=39325 RepID=A0A7J7NTV2_9MAGN|nr:hypothetical protein GIB67_017850 [Kingdonia uniflora]